MILLGIETSCDETALAFVEGKGDRVRVIKSLVASQIKIHRRYGGVVPEVAARSHALALPLLLKKILGRERERAFDAIAVAAGPGLITSLRVGTDAARSLALAFDKPLLAVNHLEGHIFANWLGGRIPELPALALIVSGGHTELVLVRGAGDYLLLGATRDDAAGEAFDKVASMLGLGYPGGPEVSRLAEKGNPEVVPLPRPMITSRDFDFSFSGLKTAIRQTVSRRPAPKRADIAASFEAAVVEVLLAKTMAAAKVTAPKTVLLAGGVAANRALRKALRNAVKKELPGVRYAEPSLEYATDNGAMIAAAGYYLARAGRSNDWRDLEPSAQWEIGV